MSWEGMRVLVTGGLGFLGCHVARTLADRGARVRVIDALLPESGGAVANLDPRGIDVVVGDLATLDLAPLVDDAQAIFHLAGQTSHLASMIDPVSDVHANLVATTALAFAASARRTPVPLVHASTRQVYGRSAGTVDEEAPVAPVDVNGVSKHAAEEMLALYHRLHGLGAVSLRLSNVYGPKQSVHGELHGFVGIFVRRALQGGRVQVYGGGAARKDLAHVDDVVEALLLAATVASLRGRVMNVGGVVHSVREVAEAVARLTGASLEDVPFPEERAAIDVWDTTVVDARFRKATGWAPKVPLVEGLERTIAFYRAHPDRLVGSG